MPVYKDKNGTWYVMTRCDDWQGQRKQKCKRGFKTKREAQDWERRFLLQQGGELDMLFKDFYKLYEQDMKARLKQNTWEHMPDMEKVKALTSLLEERSGLDVREAVVRFYNYLSIEETRIYDKETDYLLNTLGVEIELPF